MRDRAAEQHRENTKIDEDKPDKLFFFVLSSSVVASWLF
jgi:hypothetical protein